MLNIISYSRECFVSFEKFEIGNSKKIYLILNEIWNFSKRDKSS